MLTLSLQWSVNLNSGSVDFQWTNSDGCESPSLILD